MTIQPTTQLMIALGGGIGQTCAVAAMAAWCVVVIAVAVACCALALDVAPAWLQRALIVAEPPRTATVEQGVGDRGGRTALPALIVVTRRSSSWLVAARCGSARLAAIQHSSLPGGVASHARTQGGGRVDRHRLLARALRVCGVGGRHHVPLRA
ncbi:MAG TPA: hypothetical protein VF909_09905 [Roseiflexaceae bacterium]